MAFNWVLELDRVLPVIARWTKTPLVQARNLLLMATVPDVVPCFARIQFALVKVSLAREPERAVEDFVWNYGFCDGYPIERQPLENPTRVALEAARLREGGNNLLLDHRKQLAHSLAAAKVRRALARSALLERTGAHLRWRLRALLDALILGANEEEDRHWWELRALRNFRLLLEAKGLDPASSFEEDLLEVYDAPRFEPRGLFERTRWPVIVECAGSFLNL